MEGLLAVGADLQAGAGLERAVMLSLFTWRRAEAHEVAPGDGRRGWCGDSLSAVAGDKFGSKLWLLARQNVTSDVQSRARAYAQEALAWLKEDGVCASIEVTTERTARDQLGLRVQLFRENREVLLDLRFADMWSVIDV